MSVAKKTFTKSTRKNPWAGAKKFTNDELLEIFAKHDESKSTTSWMSFDIKNENQNEKMKDKCVRYLTILVTDLEGKLRPLSRSTAACATKSKCKPGKTDDGQISGKFSFSTRILIPQRIGDPNPEDEKKLVDQAWIDAKIDELADKVVSEKFPDIPEDEFVTRATQQATLIRAEYKQWLVEQHIGEEFVKNCSNKEFRAAIKWAYKPKDHKIQSNVQYDRTPSEANPEDMAQANEDGVIPLEQPMVYHGIQVNKNTGELWCKIYDKTTPVKGGKNKIACMKNESGKLAPLSSHTLEAWLRPGSVCIGIESAQACIHGKGISLHCNFKELHVRRALKSEADSQLDDETTSQLDLFGGQFGHDDDEDEDDEPLPSAPKAANIGNSKLTGIEAQMAALQDNAEDD